MLFSTPFITIYALALTAILGLCMGSFLNCMAWRTVHGEPIAKGRSHCALCGHALAGRDLIPVFSWLFLKGRCRYCGEKISPRYLTAEVITALLFVAVVLRFDLTWRTLEYLILLSLLIAAVLCDFEAFLLPDRFTLAGIVNYLVFTLCLSRPLGEALLTGVLGALVMSVPLLLISLVMDRVLKRESMGGGDLKLLFMLGLYLDWKQGILCLILSCVIGLLFALVYHRKPSSGDEPEQGAFPFGCSIAAAAFLTLLFGERVVNWYLGLFSLL